MNVQSTHIEQIRGTLDVNFLKVAADLAHSQLRSLKTREWTEMKTLHVIKPFL